MTDRKLKVLYWSMGIIVVTAVSVFMSLIRYIHFSDIDKYGIGGVGQISLGTAYTIRTIMASFLLVIAVMVGTVAIFIARRRDRWMKAIWFILGAFLAGSVALLVDSVTAWYNPIEDGRWPAEVMIAFSYDLRGFVIALTQTLVAIAFSILLFLNKASSGAPAQPTATAETMSAAARVQAAIRSAIRIRRRPNREELAAAEALLQ